MEDFDRLVISLLDSDAMKGCFKKELAKALNIPIRQIKEIWMEHTIVDGMDIQEVYVSFINAKLDKNLLMKLPFKYIYENCIVFEVGDMLL